MGEKLKEILTWIARVAAVILLLLMVFMFCYTAFKGSFIPGNVMTILSQIQSYLTVGLIGCVTLSFAADKGLIAFIAVAILVAALVIFSFFPGVVDSLMTYIPAK